MTNQSGTSETFNDDDTGIWGLQNGTRCYLYIKDGNIDNERKKQTRNVVNDEGVVGMKYKEFTTWNKIIFLYLFLIFKKPLSMSLLKLTI